MKSSTVPAVAAVALLLVLAGKSLLAAPPWLTIAPFVHVESDPRKSYSLTDQHGPWLVLAYTFSGEGAEEDAHRLAVELRKNAKLKAYTYKRHYNYTDDNMSGLGLYPSGRPVRMRYQNPVAFDEVAVLVGDFADVDDPRLQKTLERIRTLKPECLSGSRGTNTAPRFASIRDTWRRISERQQQQPLGPMRFAFATRNPTLPAQGDLQPVALDQFVLEMNRGVEYSLLDCPGRYSVRVATFRGNVVIDQRKIDEYERTGRTRNQLEDAALKANKLTLALRAQGVEAYEFHDRHESCVTVGSFDTLGTPGWDGRHQVNPAMQKVIDQFTGQRVTMPGAGGQMIESFQPKRFGGITLDVQPVPVETPRRSLAAVYARGPR